ncbi:hypothetical protein [Nocardia seriolae]|nr:hypothetical protein [Nocardia seriolae]APB00577.1 hypothetical protein NS506_06544 [Nocardia seriolae]MTJ61929.1 hypothetical protein [Nocardia seriolae]MTJ76156.1 hypothetical protein [Nocardia seriolae]MTJ90043.1 hypothetical protein [Nocardia seriolae]MTK34016.1 hypothetical protein [Nocardia seriolae]
MQSKTARGVFVALAAGAALAAAPAVASAQPLELEPYTPDTTHTTVAPVGSLFDTNSVSGLSSNVTSRLACVVQSISQQVDCLNGAA